MKLRRIFAVLVAAATLGFGSAQDLTTVKAAMEAAGTFSWIVHGMEYFGTAEANGLRVEGTVYASKQAVEIALRGGEAQVAVDDFLGPVILRSNDVPVSGIYPFAKAVGGLVVPVASDIDSIDDLRGATIAAGSLRDKSLLILRALAVSQYGFDPQDEAEIVAAAPPLMMELIASGEADAALPFWHFVARMEAAGTAREVMPVTDMLAALGLPGDLPNLMVVARDDLPAEVKTAFIQTLIDTVDVMKATPNDDPFWQTILDQGLYTLPDPTQFPLVVDRWRLGTPDGWTDAHIDGLVNMVERLVELAGAEVVGVDSVPREAYTTAFVPQ